MKIYLASPFSHRFLIVRIYRFIKACRIAGRLIKQGHIVYSPIAHSGAIHWLCRINGDHRTWEHQNLGWIEWADEVWVATEMQGWLQSRGVAWERETATKMGKKVDWI